MELGVTRTKKGGTWILDKTSASFGIINKSHCQLAPPLINIIDITYIQYPEGSWSALDLVNVPG